MDNYNNDDNTNHSLVFQVIGWSMAILTIGIIILYIMATSSLHRFIWNKKKNTNIMPSLNKFD